MTSIEFNEKYANFLEPNHYGMGINMPIVCDIMDKYFQEWIKFPGFRFSQIKMKFNYPCIYVDGVPDELVRLAYTELYKLFNKT